MAHDEALDYNNDSLEANITSTSLSKDLETQENIYRFLKSVLIYGSLSVLYLATALKIFSKLRFNLDPIHVFHIFILFDMSADISTYYILSLEYMLFKSCKISILLALFFKLSMSIDLIICQIDRFLALYLNAKYNNFMTAQIALDICLTRFRLSIVAAFILPLTCLSKVLCVIPPVVTVLVRPDEFTCPADSKVYPYIISNMLLVFFNSLTKFIAALVVIFVSIYVLVLMKDLNKIVPLSSSINYVERNISVINPLDNHISNNWCTENENEDEKPIERRPRVMFSNERTQENADLEISVIEAINTEETGGGGEHQTVQRLHQEPFMFYRVQQNQSRQRQRDFRAQCLRAKSDVLQIARRAVQINIVTISLLMSMLPHNVYNVLLYIKAVEFSFLIRQILGGSQLPFVIMFPFLIYKKLIKSHI